MVVYLDLVFLLNALADGLALTLTARVAGIDVRRKRLLIAAMAGGIYGVLCALPGISAAGSLFPQMAVSAGLVRLAYGSSRDFLRRFLLFFLISCAMSGLFTAMPELLGQLRWGVFFLVGGLCYGLLSVIFRGGAKHAVAGELCRGTIHRQGRAISFTALLDTGHTLTDSGGRQVLILELSATRELWSEAEWRILRDLPMGGAADCMARLGEIAPAAFRLLPYRAVGVSVGMLLCFRSDQLVLGGCDRGAVTVALGPTPVSDGGGYSALWGGDIIKREEQHAA